MKNIDGIEPLFDTEQAAKFLSISKRTLENWRVSGGGPAYLKLGAKSVRYPKSGLMEFVRNGMRVTTGLAFRWEGDAR